MGLSGPPLSQHSLTLCRTIKENFKDTIVIGGGGITHINMANKFYKFGADHIGVSTLLFNPIKFSLFYYKYINNVYK